MLQVANIKIIKTKINTMILTPARVNKRSIAPCNRSPIQIVNFDPFVSANCPPTLDPMKLQIPARNKTPLISVMEREDAACKKGVI